MQRICVILMVTLALLSGCDDSTDPPPANVSDTAGTPDTADTVGDTSGDASSDAAEATGETVQVDSGPKPPITCPFSGTTGTAVGDVLGAYELRDCKYTLTELSALACGNQATLIAIGAGWSVGSTELAPVLGGLWTKHQADGLMVVQVLTENNPGQTVSSGFCDDWTTEHSVAYPVLMDATKVTAPLFGGVDTLPGLVLIGGDGVIQQRWQGTLPGDLGAIVAAAL